MKSKVYCRSWKEWINLPGLLFVNLFRGYRSQFIVLTCLFIRILSTEFVYAEGPLAFHHLIEVPIGGEVLISLLGYNSDGYDTDATIHTVPPFGGTLYQLSYNFNKQGIGPTTGKRIENGPTLVTGTNNRVVYARPKFDQDNHPDMDIFNYTVFDGKKSSMAGNIVIVGPDHVLVQSNFLFGIDGWTIEGNKEDHDVLFDHANLSGPIRRFIYGFEKIRNVDSNNDDLELWHFVAPEKFSGWWGIAYDGYLEFDFASFTGNFSSAELNFDGDVNIVEISCNECRHFRGITLGYPLMSANGFDGSVTSFSLPLNEKSGWLKKPDKPSLTKWEPPTKCEMIQVLSSISKIKILGDLTRWWESVILDNVQIRSSKPKGRRHLPRCAQHFPDGSKCSCLSDLV